MFSHPKQGCFEHLASQICFNLTSSLPSKANYLAYKLLFWGLKITYNAFSRTCNAGLTKKILLFFIQNSALICLPFSPALLQSMKYDLISSVRDHTITYVFIFLPDEKRETGIRQQETYLHYQTRCCQHSIYAVSYFPISLSAFHSWFHHPSSKLYILALRRVSNSHFYILLNHTM